GVLHAVYGVFFFFQAEDGIRDRNVTGVQTCALPIYIADPLGLAGLRTFMLDYFLPLWTWLRWPVIFGLSQMLIALLYHVAPNVRQGRFRLFTAGSVSALLVLTLIGVGFRTYLNNFLHIGMYGALGGIIG